MPKATATHTILITAAEASGDRLGAALMAALKKKKKGIRFVGIGGPEMTRQGLSSCVPMQQLAVMGLLEVLPAIPRIAGILKKVVALAEKEKPQLIITIDGHDFSTRLAKRLKPMGVPHLHYNAPKVWAWRQGRAAKLHQVYTHLLALFPFEVAFFKRYNMPTTYVGHPAVTAMANYPATGTHQSLALLPGSRGAELAQHWPLMLATYRRLKKLIPQLGATLVLPTAQAEKTCRALAPWQKSEGIRVVSGEERFSAMAECRVALAKSGTNNLEMALMGLPAVVCYRMNSLSYWLAKHLVKVAYISLPNIILNRCIYPEFIQHAATPENLGRALYPLLTQAKAHQHQVRLLSTLGAAMATPQSPAEMAAQVVLNHLPNASKTSKVRS